MQITAHKHIWQHNPWYHWENWLFRIASALGLPIFTLSEVVGNPLIFLDESPSWTNTIRPSYRPTDTARCNNNTWWTCLRITPLKLTGNSLRPIDSLPYTMVRVRKLWKSDHWKREDDSVILAAVEGEGEGRRRDWVDNIAQWQGACAMNSHHERCLQTAVYGNLNWT